jgi:hypothetical protein
MTGETKMYGCNDMLRRFVVPLCFFVCGNLFSMNEAISRAWQEPGMHTFINTYRNTMKNIERSNVSKADECLGAFEKLKNEAIPLVRSFPQFSVFIYTRVEKVLNLLCKFSIEVLGKNSIFSYKNAFASIGALSAFK